MCVTADTSAQDALNLMVSRGFRHLVRSKKKEGGKIEPFFLKKNLDSLFVMKKGIYLDYWI